jgi:DNA-binding response OmpR family regulator
MKKILVVDDDAELRANLVEALAEAGYHTESAGSAKEAIAKANEQKFDVVLLDYMMPTMSGIDALLALRKSQPNLKVVMITAFATIQNAVDAIKKGASDYISKPFKLDELLTTIRRVIEESKFEEDLKKVDVDQTLSSLASPIRRNIIKLLCVREGMRLMEITRELGIDDHTKVVFHLKILKEAGIIDQNNEKTYHLTKEGTKTVDCLKTIEKRLIN